jgi:Protein of unknown function (DUF1559)
MRRIPYVILAGTAVVLLALPGRGQPAPKPKEKERAADGPITAEQLQKSAENLKNIALAHHNYNDAQRVLPTNHLSKDGKPLLSWRVQILPYVEQDALFKQFKMDEPWDSEHNKKLVDKMPEIYAPVRGKADAGMTFYQAFGGKRGWQQPGARIPASFPDGTSNTLLVAEAAKSVIWTKPEDLTFDGLKVPELGGMFDGKFHAAFADGSVQRFRKGAPAATLKLLIDPADGMVLGPDLGFDKDEK